MDESVGLMSIPPRLEEYQRSLLKAARERREANSFRGVKDYGEVKALVERDAGFVYAGWCGSAECEAKVKEETKATIRCIPFEEFRSPNCVNVVTNAAGDALYFSRSQIPNVEKAKVKLPKAHKQVCIIPFERDYLVALLARHHGNISRAAAEAGIDRNYIHRLVKKYGLEVDRS
jgi:transcriptional regulator with GAF, ATPase, and Fis domain